MYCAACGAENPAKAIGCGRCGAALAARCAHCQVELPAGARFCPNCGQPAEARPTEPGTSGPPSSGERKQVTVLFADFAGFTAFTHKQDAEDVRDFLSSVWARLDGLIAAHGGLTEKHIGDAIIAVFGARQSREDDPAQAVRAALAMQACLADFRPARGQPVLQIRIGIHTGPVVVGPLGASGELIATGDAVNLASRLQQSAPPGGVLVSQDCYRHVYGFFDMQGLPPFTVKGRPEPLQTYVILRAKPRGLAMQLRGVEGVEARMIGRERELKCLQSALERVIASGESEVLTIVGEAGIGKSCLVREFQKWAELLPQSVRLFSGRATAQTLGLPFSLIRDALCARFEIQDSDAPGIARDKLERGLLRLQAAGAEDTGSPKEEATLQAHFIGQLLGLDFSASPWLREILNDPNQIRQRAFYCFSRFFAAVSREKEPAPGDERAAVQAAVLIAEDIHWCDEGSLDLLSYLGRACNRVPLLIVSLARPALFERRPRWGEDLPAHQRLNLEVLSPSESLALVEDILRKTPQIPPVLRELIIGGAEGIPFYIEEIINMLIDQKVIVPGDEQWHVEQDRLAATRVPPTLTGILQARLDTLLPEERLVLHRAAVLGRIFWDRAVERLSVPADRPANVEGPLSRNQILEALAGLRRKELIFRRESSAFAGAVEYAFKHELLRNVAYESILKKLRREHHQRAALWLIEQSGERVNEFAGLVASHFEQAERLAEAAEWYGRAGQQARASYTPATAIEYFGKALALLPAAVAEEKEFREKRLEWREGLAEVLGAQARFEEGLEVCTELRALAEALGDRVAQARAWNGLAFLNERLGRNRASVECAEHAETLAREAGEAGQGERVRALLLKGWAFYRISDAPAVLALGEQTRQLCLASGNRHGLATSFKLHGVAHLQLGHFPEAARFFEQGLALYEELGDRRNAASMWNNLAENARLRGDYQSAEELYEKALAAVRQIGHRESEAIYLTNLSAARLGLRKFQQAETELQEAIALTSGTNSCALSATYSFLGEACLGQGKTSPALEAARRALALAQDSENDLDLGTAWRTLGRVLGAQASPPANRENRASAADAAGPDFIPDAGTCFAEGLRVFREIQAEGEQARTLRDWAEYEVLEGRGQEGRLKTEEALAIFQRLGALAEVQRTREWLQDHSAETYP
ncbi:MAG TPA: adenylate/guanylate cyclase domain-containing protein [Candidatus Binatia bacterium]|jgi:class 3 adenylate cyclase/tetratricopeptide (TPR) repeat protein|nr:adenylate/guanylate cyclase domain-containing protein [Candidatus Binatia bacterium]